MKIFSLFLLMFMSSPSFAWYCDEVASEKNGDTLNACGIGESTDEDEARKMALHNAYKELDLICERSSDCANRALEISPLRTACKKIDLGYRCHRGVTATITDDERDPQQKALLQDVFVPKKIVQIDGRESFTKSSIVEFQSSPEGATVYVDGIEICEAPCTQEIYQGEHKVLFDLRGHDLVSRIHIIRNGKQTISQNLLSTYGYLTLLSVPDKAVVKIDNNQTRARSGIRLSPNEHVVTVESPYHQPWHRKFSIKKGENLSFDFDSQPLMSFLKISAVDSYNVPIDAKIVVNGKSMGRTPNVISVPAGKSTIELSHKGHRDQSFDIDLDVGEKEVIKKKLIPSNEKDWAFYLGFGGNGSPIKGVKVDKEKEYSCCLSFDLSLQRMITKYVSFRVVYNYIAQKNSTENTIPNYYPLGTPNTNEYLLTDFTGHQLGGALPIYLHKSDGTGFYIGPEAGYLSTKLEFKRIDYNNTGVGTTTGNAKEDSFDQSYYGVVTGVEWIKENDSNSTVGWFLLSGLRKYSDSTMSKVETKFNDRPSKFKGDVSFYFEGGLIVGF